jgi:hypothetical protein
MDIKLVFSKERAEEMLQEVLDAFEKRGSKIDEITGFSANEEKAVQLEIVKKQLLQGFMIGALTFDKPNKKLRQKLFSPLECGDAKVEELCFIRGLKMHQLLHITGQKGETPDILDQIESMTNTSRKLLCELQDVDMEFATAIGGLFLS